MFYAAYNNGRNITSLPSKVDIRGGDAFSLDLAEQLLTGWKLNVEVGNSWLAELKYEKTRKYGTPIRT